MRREWPRNQSSWQHRQRIPAFYRSKTLASPGLMATIDLTGEIVSILIVDEEADRLSALQTMLTRARRWNVVAAGSAAHALRVLASGGIQAVLTDLMAPGLGGLKLCAQIQERPELYRIPTIVLVGAEDREYLERIYTAGAYDYITKPVYFEEAVARLQAVLRNREEIVRRTARERALVAANRKLATANRELLRLAVVNPATGVANRRGFDQAMGRVWRSCARQNREVALLMIDVDFFKPYNDRLGHPAGDECLRSVAGALGASLLRPDDLLARYGGEEFAVILPQTDLPSACVVAERLRQNVQNLDILHPASPAGNRVTISQGVACQIPGRGSNSTRLIATADQALYEAKRSGRNQVWTCNGAARLALSDFAAG